MIKRLIPSQLSQRFLLAAGLMLLPGPPVIRGAEPPAPDQNSATVAPKNPEVIPTQIDVQRLVDQLSADQLNERNTALQRLIQAGPAILPLLPAEEEIASKSQQEAVRRLREHLSRELAEQAVRSTILEWPADSNSKILWDQLYAQAPEALAIPLTWPMTVPPSTSETRSISLWEAVNQVESWTGYRWHWDARLEKFSPVRTQETQSSGVSTSGPFRMLLEKPRLQAVPGSDVVLLRCEVRLQTEPKLRPQLAQVRMRDWSGRAGTTPLRPWSPSAEYELTFPERTSEVTQTFDLIWPSLEPAVWSLRGKASILVTAGQEAFRFHGPRLNRRQSQRRGEVQVTIRDARFTEAAAGKGEAKIRIAVNYDHGGPAFESYRVLLFHRSAWLSTANSGKIAPRSFEVLAEEDGGLEIEYQFPDLAARAIDYTFTYEAPTLLLEIPAEFQFSALAAPHPGSPSPE